MKKKALFVTLLNALSCLTLLPVGLYFLIASPPLHLWGYKSLPSVAGNSRSVYVPGSGFSGFWYHLGTLQQMRNNNVNNVNNNNNDNDLHNYDYYCYSSGCLAVVLSFCNVSIDAVAHTALSLQEAWMRGRKSRYELVHHFLQQLLPEHDEDAYSDDDDDSKSSPRSRSRLDLDFWHFLPRIKILVTTAQDGVQVRQASNRQELVDLLIKTTWIPFVTGPGLGLVQQRHDNHHHHESSIYINNNNNNNSTDYRSAGNSAGGSGSNTNTGKGDVYLDGGFSRRLHPPCRYSIHVPNTWSTFIHTLNPGLSHVLLKQFWDMGVRNGHPLQHRFADDDDDATSNDGNHQQQLDIIMSHNETWSTKKSMTNRGAAKHYRRS